MITALVSMLELLRCGHSRLQDTFDKSWFGQTDGLLTMQNLHVVAFNDILLHLVHQVLEKCQHH